MIPLIRLGLRLAGGGGAPERMRATTAVAAGAVGAWVLMNTVAIARAEATLQPGLFATVESQRLLVAVITVVAMPVVVLVATATRLSATLRDRRLAGLRLLGLSPSRTRVVAAVESGAGSAVGTLLGLVLFWLTRPLVQEVHVAGRDWSQVALVPGVLPAVLVCVAIPLLAVAVSLIPTQWMTRGAAEQARLVSLRRPSPWRLAPMAIGIVVFLLASSTASTEDISDRRALLFVAGSALCGLGLLLVVPVFVRLLADVMVAFGRRPVARIAGRRLQSQPAGVSRIVAGLLIGLFVVSGARVVIGAWEDTPQYRSAEQGLFDGPAEYTVSVPGRADPEAVATSLAAAEGVRGAYADRQVMAWCGGGGPCLWAFVGTCADVELAVPGATGCRDDQAAWLDTKEPAARATYSWEATSRPGPPPVELPSPEGVIRSDDRPHALGDALQAAVFIPVGTPGIVTLADHRLRTVIALTGPGDAAGDALQAAAREAAPGAEVYPSFYAEDYDFVAGLRAMVWAVAAVVLSVGLLSFAISAIDRAVARRAEMVSLQVLGTPRRVIRWAQWWEALLPLAVGAPLAVGLGWAVGSGYLTLGGSLDATPWQSTLGLAAVSAVGVVLIAGLSVLGCAPRVRADLIRRA